MTEVEVLRWLCGLLGFGFGIMSTLAIIQQLTLTKLKGMFLTVGNSYCALRDKWGDYSQEEKIKEANDSYA